MGELHLKITSSTSAVACEFKDKTAVEDDLLNMFALDYSRPSFGAGGAKVPAAVAAAAAVSAPRAAAARPPATDGGGGGEGSSGEMQ